MLNGFVRLRTISEGAHDLHQPKTAKSRHSAKFAQAMRIDPSSVHQASPRMTFKPATDPRTRKAPPRPKLPSAGLNGLMPAAAWCSGAKCELYSGSQRKSSFAT